MTLLEILQKLEFVWPDDAQVIVQNRGDGAIWKCTNNKKVRPTGDHWEVYGDNIQRPTGWKEVYSERYMKDTLHNYFIAEDCSKPIYKGDWDVYLKTFNAFDGLEGL